MALPTRPPILRAPPAPPPWPRLNGWLMTGAALQIGIEYALAQAAGFIVTFDADGQHRVSDISRLTEALVEERADFALGSRFLGHSPNLPPLRRLMLQAATLFTHLTTGLVLTDTHNGLRAMTC